MIWAFSTNRWDEGRVKLSKVELGGDEVNQVVEKRTKVVVKSSEVHKSK